MDEHFKIYAFPKGVNYLVDIFYWVGYERNYVILTQNSMKLETMTAIGDAI